MQKLLNKYTFTYKEDKETFERFLNKLNFSDKKLHEIIEIYLNKNSQFDTRIVYNPIELLDAILENDISWEKIDTDEVENIINKLSFFEKYYKWELSEKEFLEKKYWVKIILLDKDIQFPNVWIYGYKLLKAQQIIAFNKIKKLLNIYPITFIKNINLANIIISSYFYKKNDFWITILWWFETNTNNNIYLTIKWIEKTFHHELFHQAMQYYDDTNEWKKIRKDQDLKYLYKHIDKKIYWFARNYGKENIAEDQATIAEELITNYDNLIKRMKKDKILEKKVRLVVKAYKILSEWKIKIKWF